MMKNEAQSWGFYRRNEDKIGDCEPNKLTYV